MEPDDLPCSRNARPPKALARAHGTSRRASGGRVRKLRAQWKINQPPSLKRERASLEGLFISFDARN
jgi:hypothetical protein